MNDNPFSKILLLSCLRLQRYKKNEELRVKNEDL